MRKGDVKAPSQRQLRVGEELRHALAWILERGEIRDPGLGGAAVTVTEVRVGPDLRNATAYVIPLGGNNVTEVVDALNRAAPFVRRQLGKAVKLRHLPNLNFVADTTFDEAGQVGHDESGILIHGDEAEVRAQSGKWVIGDLRRCG